MNSQMAIHQVEDTVKEEPNQLQRHFYSKITFIQRKSPKIFTTKGTLDIPSSKMYSKDVKNRRIEMQCLLLPNVLNGLQCLPLLKVLNVLKFVPLKNHSTYQLPLSQFLKYADLAYRSLLIV